MWWKKSLIPWPQWQKYFNIFVMIMVMYMWYCRLFFFFFDRRCRPIRRLPYSKVMENKTRWWPPALAAWRRTSSSLSTVKPNSRHTQAWPTALVNRWGCYRVQQNLRIKTQDLMVWGQSGVIFWGNLNSEKKTKTTKTVVPAMYAPPF